MPSGSSQASTAFDDCQKTPKQWIGVYLTGVHANDPGQLEILLGEAHALGLMGDVALAHLPALLVLDHTEHSKCPVLPCSRPLAISRTLGRRRRRRRRRRSRRRSRRRRSRREYFEAANKTAVMHRVLCFLLEPQLYILA